MSLAHIATLYVVIYVYIEFIEFCYKYSSFVSTDLYFSAGISRLPSGMIFDTKCVCHVGGNHHVNISVGCKVLLSSH